MKDAKILKTIRIPRSLDVLIMMVAKKRKVTYSEAFRMMAEAGGKGAK